MEDYPSSGDDDYYVDREEYSDVEDNLDDLGHLEFEAIDSAPASASIKVITKESLLDAQIEDLSKVMEVLSLKEHHARTLLIHYRWDVEKILTVLVERDRDYLFTKAGVPVLESDNLAIPELPSLVMCIICMEDVPTDEITTMDCGHYFCNTCEQYSCNNCWTKHFTVKIHEGQSKHIKCMAHECNAVCDEAKVRTLVSAKNPTLVKKFDRYLLESYIEDNEKVKWCPSVPHCGNAIRSTCDDLCEVECACGLAFCFGCSSEPHSPCSCQMWELWSQKCRDESETMNWIAVNTKPCPKCHKLVEKNGGCNLVVCTCRQPFCWICGAATGFGHTYRTIDGHSCGQYTDAKKAKEETAEKQLNRYIHYHSRFKAHTNSFKLESKLKETMKEKISELEGEVSLPRDFGWVTNALDRLFRSRRILSCTYPFAYYVFGEFGEELTDEEVEVTKNLFEARQQQLEANVEKLSLHLEKFSKCQSLEEIMNLTMEIITLTVFVDNLCRRLYDGIENDILGSLQLAPRIASYKSNGAEKASELDTSNDSKFLS